MLIQYFLRLDDSSATPAHSEGETARTGVVDIHVPGKGADRAARSAVC